MWKGVIVRETFLAFAVLYETKRNLNSYERQRLCHAVDKASMFLKDNRYLFLNRDIHILLRDTLAIKEFSILVGADIDVA